MSGSINRGFDGFHMSSKVKAIHVDAACDTASGVYSFGVVIWNSVGDSEVAMHGKYPSMLSPHCAEAHAALEGLRLGQRLNLQDIRVYSDSLELINMLNGLEDGSTDIQAIIWDITQMSVFFHSLSFHHVKKRV